MNEGQQAKVEKPRWYLLLIPVAVICLGLIVWLNAGEEACPPEAHPLMHFAMSHNLHYKMVLQQQLDKSTTEWCVYVWPKAQHWYSADDFSVAGSPYHPLWRSCATTLKPAIDALIADYEKSPTGDYTYVPNKTLIECTH